MAKVKFLVLAVLWLLLAGGPLWAADINAVTPVFIVRSRDQWRAKGDPKHLEFLIKTIADNHLPATWLLQADALDDPVIVDRLKAVTSPVEFGLFLEISQDLAEEAKVRYPWYEGQWTAANRLFTSGYTRGQRLQLMARAMAKFKAVFGNYPRSVGAWHIDGWSLNELRQQYGVTELLGLADQYSTDGYQVWGGYINQPYYPSVYDPLEPGTAEKKLDIVKTLWAPRKQVLAFSREKLASNFSVQVNDYHRMMKQPPEYFPQLLQELTTDIDLLLAQAVIGIEAAELEDAYWPELKRQLELLTKQKSLRLLTLTEFGSLYRQIYPQESPSILLESNSGETKSWWYMSSQYRLGLRFQDNQLTLIDLRYYQTLPVHDNDQRWPDSRANLYRVVPALIDEVSLDLVQPLGEGPVTVEKATDLIRLKFAGNKSLNLYPSKLTFDNVHPDDLSAINREYLSWSNGVLRLKPPEFKRPKVSCFGRYGYFKPPLSCLKTWLSDSLERLPDVRASKISGRYYFGVRTGPEELTGIAALPLETGRLRLPFSVLEYFLSSTSFYPRYPWIGRQELQLQLWNQPEGTDKGGSYGQDKVLEQLPVQKRFENGYYLVPR